MSKTKQQILNDICKEITSLSEQSRLNEEAIVNNIVKYIVVHKPDASNTEIVKMASEFFNRNVDAPTVQKGIRAGFYNRFGRSFLSVRVKSAKSLAQKMYDVLFNEGPYKSLEEEYEDTKKYIETLQIAMYAFVDMLPANGLSEYVIKLDKPFSCDCFDALVSYAKVELSTDVSDYEKEILRLEAEKNRANSLISRLQDEFDEQLEESKREEQEKLIQQLNSSKYDCILDQLTSIQAGLRKMRRERIAVPLQINSLPALVRQLLQFVEDCGITPIQDIGEELEITSVEAEYYQYQGSPFSSEKETKQVVVVATGWEIKEKELILSPPTVQEVKGEEIKITAENDSSDLIPATNQHDDVNVPQDLTEPNDNGQKKPASADSGSTSEVSGDPTETSPDISDDCSSEIEPEPVQISSVSNESRFEEKNIDNDDNESAGSKSADKEISGDSFVPAPSDKLEEQMANDNAEEGAVLEEKQIIEPLIKQPAKLPPIETIGAACMKMKQDGIVEHSVEEVRDLYYPGGKMGGILDKYKRAGLIELYPDKTRFIWLATEEKWERYLQKRREGKEQSSVTRQSRQVGGK